MASRETGGKYTCTQMEKKKKNRTTSYIEDLHSSLALYYPGECNVEWNGECVSIRCQFHLQYLSEMNLTSIKNSFAESILFLSNLLYPICHYNSRTLKMEPKNFKTLLNNDFIVF